MSDELAMMRQYDELNEEFNREIREHMETIQRTEKLERLLKMAMEALREQIKLSAFSHRGCQCWKCKLLAAIRKEIEATAILEGRVPEEILNA